MEKVALFHISLKEYYLSEKDIFISFEIACSPKGLVSVQLFLTVTEYYCISKQCVLCFKKQLFRCFRLPEGVKGVGNKSADIVKRGKKKNFLFR